MVTRGKSDIQVNAYLAGIIDGEGHISINRNKSCPQRRKNPRYQAEVTVVNTDIRLMEYLVEYIGGSFYKRKKSKEWHKDTYQWKVTSTTARELCKRLLPYLLLKKGQAECIIRLYDECDFNMRVLTADELVKREKIYQQLLTLNDSRRPQRLTEGDLICYQDQVCDSLNTMET